MAIVAPKGRKHLSADALFRLLQNGFDTIPDHRLTDTEISLGTLEKLGGPDDG